MKYVLKQKSKEANGDAVKKLAADLGVSATFACVLCCRGLADAKAADLFLNPTQEQMNDPFLFSDMADSVSTVKNVVAKKGDVLIYGDYDADGTAGCAILYTALKGMGARVSCHLPSRMEHGYGLSMEAVESMKGTALLITVDCGITNVAEIARAKELGIRTIVTDHHECGPVLPRADYILNAKRPGETYPCRDLCGAAVAFKLAQALTGREAYEMIDVAAIATIADIVPLTQENRVIAKLGLDKLNSRPNPGIQALVKAAGVKSETIDSQTVAYALAPRINAAGRISTARTAFELMAERDEARLRELAERLCELNTDRQGRQERVSREAMEMQAGMPASRLAFFHRDDWDVGIVGRAASRVAEKYNRPAILFGKSGDLYTGSARSIEGVNIFEALAAQAELCEKFGGHAGAAGLTVREENLETLKARLTRYMDENYTEEVFRPVKYYDIALPLAAVTPEQIAEFSRLRPFGHKNGPVELLLRNAEIADIRAIGEDRHSRFTLKSGNASLSAVYFGVRTQNIPQRADAVGTAQINSFDGRPQMVVEALSFEPSLARRFEDARAYVENSARPRDRKKYAMDREKLLGLYVVLRAIRQNDIAFDGMEELLVFLQRHVRGLSAEKAAFALAVLGEINLLELEKGDKIRVVLHSGRHDLGESEVYNKFVLEDDANGFEGEDQEHKGLS